MALPIQKGTLTAPGATGNQTTNLDSSIFTASEPLKAIILWFNNSTAVGLTNQDNIWSMGFGTYRGGTPQQVAVGSFDDDAAATGAVGYQAGTASILRGTTAAGTTVDYDVALVSFADAAFTLNWTNLPTTASTIVHFLALGGSDITDALVGSKTTTIGAAAEDVAATAGFGQPDLIFATGGPWNSASTTTVGPAFFSAAKSATERRAARYASYGGATMNIGAWHKDRFIVATGSTNATDWEADLDAKANWPTDGFRIASPDVSAFAFIVYYLMLKGTFTATIGSSTAPTAAAPQTQDLALASGTPQGAITFGCHVAANTGLVTTGTDLGGFFLGAYDGTNQGVAGIIEESANTAAICGTSHSTSDIIEHLDAAAAGPLLQSQAQASFSGSNLHLNWDDTDTVARSFSYVLLGSNGGAPAVIPDILMAPPCPA